MICQQCGKDLINVHHNSKGYLEFIKEDKDQISYWDNPHDINVYLYRDYEKNLQSSSPPMLTQKELALLHCLLNIFNNKQSNDTQKKYS